MLAHAAVFSDVSCRFKTRGGVFLEVRINNCVLAKHAPHSFKNSRVYLTVISGPRDLHFAFNSLDVNKTARYIGFLNLPNTSRKRKTVADGGRGGYSTDLVRAATDCEILRVLEHCVKLKRTEQLFTGKTDDKSFFLGKLQEIVLNHRNEQSSVILF